MHFYSQLIQAETGDVIKQSVRCNQVVTDTGDDENQFRARNPEPRDTPPPTEPRAGSPEARDVETPAPKRGPRSMQQKIYG